MKHQQSGRSGKKSKFAIAVLAIAITAAYGIADAASAKPGVSGKKPPRVVPTTHNRPWLPPILKPRKPVFKPQKPKQPSCRRVGPVSACRQTPYGPRWRVRYICKGYPGGVFTFEQREICRIPRHKH